MACNYCKFLSTQSHSELLSLSLTPSGKYQSVSSRRVFDLSLHDFLALGWCGIYQWRTVTSKKCTMPSTYRACWTFLAGSASVTDRLPVRTSCELSSHALTYS